MATRACETWAILIGVGYYVHQKPVRGAVNDVQLMKAFLESACISAKITTLTASEPNDESTLHPPEQSNLWPTVNNVTLEMERIISQARAGDTVYIHYSGHGTKDSSQNLALALYDEKTGLGCLQGLELAEILARMVAAGLAVTMVLDCCFSGRVRRQYDQDISPRGFDFDPAVHPAFPVLNESTTTGVPEALRNARLTPDWLVDPKGYAILCACTPDQVCQEIEVNRIMYGSLSYYLHRALVYLYKAGNDISHRSIYGYICAKFQAEWPKQLPMRYGNKNFSMFGKLLPEPDWTFIPVFRRKSDNRLYLQNGQAHGVQEDDEYAIYPVDSEESGSLAGGPAPLYKVHSVGALTSELEPSDRSSSVGSVRSGWKAKPHTQISQRNIALRLRIDDPNMDEWIAATVDRRFVTIYGANAGEQPSSLSIILRDSCVYEVVDESSSGRATLPTVASDRNRSMHLILDIVDHVATYKYIEALENRQPNRVFAQSIQVDLRGGMTEETTGRTEEATGLTVQHESEIFFQITNTSSKEAYLHLYDLGPLWQIAGLIERNGGGDFLVIPAGSVNSPGLLESKIEMTVPDVLINEGEGECKDVLKFFITSDGTSFAALELDGLSNPAAPHGERPRNNRNQLGGFLETLKIPHRGGKSDKVEDWIALNFSVKTICKKSKTD